MTLHTIIEFRIPAEVASLTDAALREAGGAGYELFVLWTGEIRGRTFHVQHAYIPDQRSYRGHGDVHVRVDADALHHLNVWLFKHSQVLGIQVHSHPTDAFHSDTDDTFPIVTTVGGLSIVVPDFAREGIRGSELAIYRLTASGWRHLPGRTVHRLLKWEPR